MAGYDLAEGRYENLTFTFDQLFGTFTEVYWNLVLKHGIRQQPVSERSNGTY